MEMQAEQLLAESYFKKKSASESSYTHSLF